MLDMVNNCQENPPKEETQEVIGSCAALQLQLIFLTSLKPGENSIYITYQLGREERKLVVGGGVEVVCTICASCWL